MAEEDADSGASGDEEHDLNVEGKKGSPIKMIIIIVIVLAVLGGGGFAAMTMMGGGNTAAEVEEEEVVKEDSGKEKKEKRKIKASGGQALYAKLNPAFVVNFKGNKGRSRFLQIDVVLMTRDSEVRDAIKLNKPLLKNNLNLLFSNRDYKEIGSVKGREKLRAEALKVVQTTMMEQIGQSGVEAVLFTNFVMQ